MARWTKDANVLIKMEVEVKRMKNFVPGPSFDSNPSGRFSEWKVGLFAALLTLAFCIIFEM